MCENDTTIIIAENLQPTTVVISDSCNDVTVLINETVQSVTIELASNVGSTQLQSDFLQTDNQAPDFIKNKPTIPNATSDLINNGADGINPFITSADVTPQVNSNWNATSGVAQILNKPTIPSIDGLATVVYVDAQDNLKVDKVTGYSLTKNDLTDALKSIYDNAVSSLTTLLASGLRLITSAEITKLSNTSGVNTGDQDLSGLVPKTRTITINGLTKDLTANQNWTIGGLTGVRTPYTFIATAGQTTFTTVGYTVGQIDVYYNGSKQLPSEYTATNGTTVVFPTGKIAGDEIEIVVWTVSDIASTLALDTSGFGEDKTFNSTTNTLTIDKYSWMDLARGYTVEPTLFTATATYEVYTYVYSSSTFYRKIMNDGSLDGFYSESTLTNKLCEKKIIL
jgi:hypothetical protein